MVMDVDTVMTSQTSSSTSSGNGIVANSTSSSSSTDADELLLVLKAMKQREKDYLIGDYLKELLSSEESSDRNAVNVECRKKMYQWALSIMDFCRHHKDTAAVGMNILDRFLSVSPWALKDRSAFQLAAITSLYMSIKLNETVGVGLDLMVELSKGIYTEHQFESMERVILGATRWRINPPTSFQFGYRLAQWMECQDKKYPFDTVLHLINTQLEAAISDYGLVTVSPSLVAVAALFNAIEGMGVVPCREQLPLVNYIASTLDFAGHDSLLIKSVQARLYEIISGRSTPTSLIQSDVVSPTADASNGSVPSMAAPYKEIEVRPISPNSVSLSDAGFCTPSTTPVFGHSHSSAEHGTNI